MKLQEILDATRQRKLTCSQVMEILMDQPTRPDGRKIESHAHMHMQEGFTLSRDGFKGSDFSFRLKKIHWEGDSHLLPSGSRKDDFGRLVFDDADGRDFGYDGVMQDNDRLPPDRSYSSRTGLDELPKIDNSRIIGFEVLKFPNPMGRPFWEKKNGASEASIKALKPLGRDAGHYLPSKSDQSIPEYRPLYHKEVIPEVGKSPAHTMFPDSESLVMHLTGALNSIAGVMALEKLLSNRAGSSGTVAIFSRSAALSVQNKDAGVKNELIERTLEVDKSAPRNKTTGFFPSTGVVRRPRFDIDHVDVILGYRNTGELNIITCYPSRQTIYDSIKIPTTDAQDVAELVFEKDHRVVTQDVLPSINW